MTRIEPRWPTQGAKKKSMDLCSADCWHCSAFLPRSTQIRRLLQAVWEILLCDPLARRCFPFVFLLIWPFSFDPKLRLTPQEAHSAGRMFHGSMAKERRKFHHFRGPTIFSRNGRCWALRAAQPGCFKASCCVGRKSIAEASRSRFLRRVNRRNPRIERAAYERNQER